jgi:hypothetical protein
MGEALVPSTLPSTNGPFSTEWSGDPVLKVYGPSISCFRFSFPLFYFLFLSHLI